MPVIIAGLVTVGDAGGGNELRQPEVQHFRRAVLPDLDVRRLQVAMDDAGVVRGGERHSELAGDLQRLVDRDRAQTDPVRQGRPLDEFEHERADSLRVLDAVDRRDVRMIQ